MILLLKRMETKRKLLFLLKLTGKVHRLMELNFYLSLATCFWNDIYREAVRRKINIQSVEVTVSGEFGKEAEPASNITYKAAIQSDAPQNEIRN